MIDSSSNEESKGTMETEQGLAARELVALDLENEQLANTNQVLKKTDTVDATDAPAMEIQYISLISSSEAVEAPQESPTDPITEVLIQTSVLEDDKIVEYSDNINNEEGISPVKTSFGAKAESVVETEPDARGTKPVLSKPSRGPRYFDPAEFNLPTCNNYDGFKAKKKRKRCYICGDTGHEGQRCKQVNECFICSKKGHLVMNCPKKKVEVDSTSKLCLMCGNTGHDMFSCTSGYDSEDMKAVECYICQKVGHLCCAENKAEGPREGSCYNCGQSGHFGSECPKLIEDAHLLQLVCSKCGDKGHLPEKCTKPISAKAAKRKARDSRRRRKKNKQQQPMPPTNPSYQDQPSRWRGLQNVGPYYGNRASNVWLSPAAAAAREALPFCQHVDHQVETQLPNYPFNPLTPYGSSRNGTQIPEMILYQETRTMLPQTATQIQQQNPVYLMNEVPHPMWDCNKETQIPQPHFNRRSGIVLPQVESRVPQYSSDLPAHLPHLIWKGGQQQPPSHSTPVMIGQVGTQIPQHPFNHQAGNMLPHQGFNHQTIAPLPYQNRNSET